MKTYTTKTIPQSTVKYVSSIRCDLCGSVTTKEWRESNYDATEIKVSMKTGDNYPSGGSGELTTVDICPTCFKEKLIPWVNRHGGEPTVTEWDW